MFDVQWQDFQGQAVRLRKVFTRTNLRDPNQNPQPPRPHERLRAPKSTIGQGNQIFQDAQELIIIAPPSFLFDESAGGCGDMCLSGARKRSLCYLGGGLRPFSAKMPEALQIP